MKLVFILLLAVGYSLQTPVEIQDVQDNDDDLRTEVPFEPEVPEEPFEPEVPEVPFEPEVPERVSEEVPEITEEPELPEIIEINPDGECPEVDPEFPVFLSDLKNCSVFYQCAHGIPYRMSCSYPLEFNPTLNVCDFPGVSGCILDKRAPFRIIGRCPPNSGIKKLLRDSEDNTIYYECVNGSPVLRNCPEGTIFTPRRVCAPAA